MITELPDRGSTQVFLVENVNFNFKIKLIDKTAPLKIFVTYQDSEPNKEINFWMSHSVK